MEKVTQIKVNPFVECRIKEIESLMEIMKNPKKGGGRNLFQTLPRHMIRRAASGDVRRIPKRIRNLKGNRKNGSEGSDARKNSANTTPSEKLVNRRSLRKPCALRLKYARRQASGDQLWLETHIWHAKRFKMTKRWNYSIPYKPNDKCFRHCFRQARNGCTIQDVSYLNCIQVCFVDSAYMSERLSHITDPRTRANFLFKPSSQVTVERRAFLYRPDEYPFGAIGPASYYSVKVPSTNGESVDNFYSYSLYLWVHPSIHDEVLGVLGTILKLPSVASYLCVDRKSAVPTVISEGESRVLQSLRQALNILGEGTDLSESSGIKRSSESDPNPSVPKKRQRGPERSSDDRASGVPKRRPYSRECDHTVTAVQTFTRDISPTSKEGGDPDEGRVCLKLLKNRMVRFRLSGRLSLKVLMETAKSAYDRIKDRSTAASMSPAPVTSASGRKVAWWRTYYSQSTEGVDLQDLRLRSLEQQEKVLAALLDLSRHHFTYHNLVKEHLQAGAVLPLVVRDPRLFKPTVKKRLKPYAKLSSTTSANGVPDQNVISKEDRISLYKIFTQPGFEPSTCPFWDQGIRERVTLTKLPDHKLNAIRSKSDSALCGEWDKNVLESESYVPLLIVHRPQSHRLPLKTSKTNLGGDQRDTGYGSGWDLILPSNWAMPFWISCIYNGATPCGLNEDLSYSEERLEPHFPEHYPDTEAGRACEVQLESSALSQYAKRPKKYRPNYDKTGAGCRYTQISPYRSPWNLLINDWNALNSPPEASSPILSNNGPSASGASTLGSKPIDLKIDFNVIRDRAIIERLSLFPVFNQPPLTRTDHTSIPPNHDIMNPDSLISLNRSLIPVKVVLKLKGTLSAGMPIIVRCDTETLGGLLLPKLFDNSRGFRVAGSESLVTTVQNANSMQVDTKVERDRQVSTSASSSSLKSVVSDTLAIGKSRNKKTKKISIKLVPATEDPSIKSCDSSRIFLSSIDTVKDRDSSLPQMAEIMPTDHQNESYVVGFTSSGSYSMLKGKSCGIGYVSHEALRALGLFCDDRFSKGSESLPENLKKLIPSRTKETMAFENGCPNVRFPVKFFVKQNHSLAIYSVTLEIYTGL